MKISTTFVLLVPLWLLVVSLAAPDARWGLALGALVLGPVFLWAVRQSPIAYEVRGGRLVVHARLGATHTVRLDGTARFPAPPPRLRLFGSSGFFGHTGWFLDADWTMVRAFVTRADNMVVVGTDVRPVLVSPVDPEGFAAAVRGGVVR
ncbi:MAG: PH domain-containing protein [Pseudomonadota bacterium]|nr:PH domain-containing protein [Pseudomonadota bacterium]